MNVTAFSAEIYLSCSLANARGHHFHYSFAFDSQGGTLFWVGGSQELEVFLNTSSQLWVFHASRFRDFPYERTDFRVNRITGAAEITYLRNPTDDENPDM
jgi:hypothetical protein